MCAGLAFRLLRLEDVPGLLAWGAAYDARFEHYSFVDFDLAEAEQWYFSKQKMLSRKVFGLFCGNEILGFVTLKKINFITRTAEIGLAVNPSLNGRGYGEAMLSAHLDYVYRNFPIDRIYLDVAEFNRRARRLYEKCGFMYCGSELKAYEHQLNKNLAIDFPEDFRLQDGRLLAKFLRMEHVRGTVRINAPAKINMGLQVGKRLDSGYHELYTTMQSVSLCDVVHIRKIKKRRGAEPDVRIRSMHDGIPERKNLAYIAASKYLQCLYGCDGTGSPPANPSPDSPNFTVEISLYKRIPEGAGLGGGSTDAAAVLRGMNAIFQSALTEGELLQLAAEIGSDVPFCVRGGTAIASGRGEVLEFYDSAHSPWVLVHKGAQSLSTPAVFERFDELSGGAAGNRADSRVGVTSEAGAGDAQGACRYPNAGVGDTVEAGAWRSESRRLHEALRSAAESDCGLDDFVSRIPANDMEAAAFSLAPSVEAQKAHMKGSGAMFVSMSGSGPSLYGIFGEESAARLAQNAVGGVVCKFCNGDGNGSLYNY